MIELGAPYLVGVDIGTTTSKGLVIDSDGKVASEASFEHDVIFPKLGWAEHDPEKHWWNDFVKITRTLLDKSKIRPTEIRGIGVSGLCPSVVLLNKDGSPIRPAILYSDTRAIKEIKFMKENIGSDEILEISGNQATTQTVAPKILWVKRNEQQNFIKTRMLLSAPYNYIVYKLTGQFSMDYGTAKWFGIFDARKLMWRQDFCDQLGIPSSILPPVYDATHVIGETTEEAARDTGLPKNMPVIVGACDSAVEPLSVGVVKSGDAVFTYGTTGLLKVCCDTLKVVPGLHSDIHCIKPLRYFLGGAMVTTGALVKWFRDQFGHPELKEQEISNVDAYRILDSKAAEISPGSEGLIALPYFMGERTPIFDPLARGVVFGLTLSHTRVHIYRALLEAVGYALYNHLEILKEHSALPKRIIASGGGARSELWRQIISDIINMPQGYMETPGVPYGAAYLAGYGVGIFKDFKTISEKWVKPVAITKPRPEVHKKYEKFFKVYIKLYPVLKDLYGELADALEHSS